MKRLTLKEMAYSLHHICGTALTAAVIMTVMSACEHKNLCFNHDEHSPKSDLIIIADYEQEWQYDYEKATNWKEEWPAAFSMEYDSLRPGIPEGLRVQIFPPGGNTDIRNLPPAGGKVSMREGSNSLLLYNNDTEYIVFDDMGTFASAKATTRTRTRGSYFGSPVTKTDDELTVNEPDMLYGHYIEDYDMKPVVNGVIELPVTMHPLVFSYYVRIEVTKGLQYVALARGALAGMAAEVYLNSGKTSTQQATVLFDCGVTDFGADAVMRSFGVPNFPNDNYTRADAKYGLNVELRLKNGRMMSYDFDVTDQVAKQPHGGVITVSGIEVSDEDGKEGSSGFYVDVTDWGEFNDIILPL